MSQAYWVELKVAELMHKQEAHGVRFDRQRAGFLIHVLTEEIVKIDNEAIPQLPLMMHIADAYAKPFLKSGKLAKWPSLYCETHGIDPEKVGGPFSRVWYTPFDMGKTDKVKRVLIDHGWVPNEWNAKDLGKEDNAEAWIVNYIEKNFIEEHSVHWKNALLKALGFKGQRTRQALACFLREKKFIETSPKITEDSLDTVDGTVGMLVKRRVMLSHRRSLLQGLIKNLRSDGRSYQGANPCATPTYRMTHRNIVNIPAGRSPFGKEIRRLFLPDDGHVMVGVDAAGLELRMLAHYLNDEEYISQIVHGDIHTYNQTLAGLPERDDAKTMIYGYCYGAGDAKLGTIVGGGKKEGAAIRQKFESELPALRQLQDRLMRKAESGYLEGIDGRLLKIRRGYDGKLKTYTALNLLLQSAGAIVCKYAMVFLHQWAQHLDAHQWSHTHDEWIWTCNPRDVDELTMYMENMVRVAGEYLKLNCPLASEPLIGRTWYDVH